MDYLAEIILAVAALIGAITALRKQATDKEIKTSGEWQKIVEELKEYIERVEHEFGDKLSERDGLIELLQGDVSRLKSELASLNESRKEEIEALEYLMFMAIDHMDLLSDELVKLNVTPPQKPREIIDWLREYKNGRGDYD